MDPVVGAVAAVDVVAVAAVNVDVVMRRFILIMAIITPMQVAVRRHRLSLSPVPVSPSLSGASGAQKKS